MSLKMTSRDIAQKAGVSQSTVSRVLRGDSRVREAARQAVLAVLDATGCTPNRLARSMRGFPMGVVGVVVDNLANPFCQKLLNSLPEEVSRRQPCLVDGSGRRGSGRRGGCGWGGFKGWCGRIGGRARLDPGDAAGSGVMHGGGARRPLSPSSS